MKRWWRILTARIHGLFHRDFVAEEIREELRFHLSMRVQEYEGQGLSPQAARRRAKRRVGNLAVHQDRGYDVRGGGMMETIVQDIRYSVRLLLKQRGFAVVAIVTLALAIGAVTAVVSVIDAAMLRPLPYPDPEQLVSLGVSMPRADGRPYRPSPSMEDARTWQAATDVFSAVSAWDNVFYGRIVDGEQLERVQITEIDEQYLPMYGIEPLLGRNVNADDIAQGAPAVAILEHGYWQSRFGGDPDVLGETIRLGETPTTIIGVLPAGFADTQLLQPLHVAPDWEARRGSGMSVYGRLLPGITLEQAQERLSARMGEAEGPDGSIVEVSARVVSLLDTATGRYWTTIVALSGAVAFILSLACVNVAGLQLARGATRQPELAVRAALGAGRGRLVRQIMVENTVLAAAGALLGVVVAWLSLDSLVANLPMSLPSNAPVTINLKVLVATVLLTALTAILFGLVPAIRLSRVRVAASLTNAGGRHGSSLSRRSSQLLMGAEIALAVVLVVGAALMLRSFGRVLSVDVGFDPGSIVTVQVVPVDTDPTTHEQYYPALLRDLRLIPGIAAAGAIDYLPLAGVSSFNPVYIGDQRFGAGGRRVLPGYVETLDLPVIEGRTLSEADYAAGRNLAMLNESLARELFPDGSAVGRSFTRQDTDEQGNRIDIPWEVIGVIGDVRHEGPLRPDRVGELYLPFKAIPSDTAQGRGLIVVVRPSVPNAGLANGLREAAEAVGPRVLIESVRSGTDWLGDRVLTPRRRTVLLSLLGGLGLALALVGVFGLTAYAVARRTWEIGVRMTFGARPSQVVGAIVRDAAVPVAAGTVVGLLAAVAATRVIETFLFETPPTDPATFATVAIVLAVTGIIAAWIPARRAVRIDPLVALREL